MSNRIFIFKNGTASKKCLPVFIFLILFSLSIFLIPLSSAVEIGHDPFHGVIINPFSDITGSVFINTTTNNYTLYNGSLWNETMGTGIFQRNLSNHVGIGVNNPDLSALYIRDIDDNNTFVSISTGDAGGNATIIWRELDVVRWHTYYNAKLNTWGVWNSNYDRDYLTLFESGVVHVKVNSNFSAIENVWSPNLCYANGTNCNTTFSNITMIGNITGNLTINGNLTADYLFGNGTFITGVQASGGTYNITYHTYNSSTGLRAYYLMRGGDNATGFFNFSNGLFANDINATGTIWINNINISTLLYNYSNVPGYTYNDTYHNFNTSTGLGYYYVRRAGDNITGNINMSGNNITNINYLNPSRSQINIGGNISVAGNLTVGGTYNSLSGNLNMSGNNITNIHYLNPSMTPLYVGGNMTISGNVTIIQNLTVMGDINSTGIIYASNFSGMSPASFLTFLNATQSFASNDINMTGTLWIGSTNISTLLYNYTGLAGYTYNLTYHAYNTSYGLAAYYGQNTHNHSIDNITMDSNINLMNYSIYNVSHISAGPASMDDSNTIDIGEPLFLDGGIGPQSLSSTGGSVFIQGGAPNGAEMDFWGDVYLANLGGNVYYAGNIVSKYWYNMSDGSYNTTYHNFNTSTGLSAYYIMKAGDNMTGFFNATASIATININTTGSIWIGATNISTMLYNMTESGSGIWNNTYVRKAGDNMTGFLNATGSIATNNINMTGTLWMNGNNISNLLTNRIRTNYTRITWATSNATGSPPTWWNNTMQFPVAAYTNYTIECILTVYAQATTTGVHFNFTAPLSPTQFNLGIIHPTTATAGTTFSCTGTGNSCYDGSITSVTATTGLPVGVNGILLNGANAGNFNVYMKSEVAGSLATLVRGSYCTLTALES